MYTHDGLTKKFSFERKGMTYSLTPLTPKKVSRDQLAMRESRDKHLKHMKSKCKEDKELLVASCKEVQKVKHLHKPLCLFLPNIVCSMDFDKGIRVDQEKIKRQFINFLNPKHLKDNLLTNFYKD